MRTDHLRIMALSWRLLRREWRSGELALITTALILAVTVTTSITLFSDRLQQAMQQQADQWLGADQRYSSSQAMPQHWLSMAQNADLTTAQTVSFASMVFAKDELVLAAIKAVDNGYPLDADIQIQQDNKAVEKAIKGPSIGQAWAEPRLLAQLGLKLGERISVGNRELIISANILRETDRGGNLYSLSPRLMVNWQDVIDQSLLGPGSRATYRLLTNGEPQALMAFNNAVANDLEQRPDIKLEGLSENNQAMAGALDKAQQYLGLSSILAVILASIAIAVAAQRYSERHYDVAALLRTLGLTSSQVFRLFTLQLTWVGLIATAIGCLFAALLHLLLIEILADLLPPLMPQASLGSWLIGASSGFISLLGFAIPQLLPVGRVAPLRVLRRELLPVAVSGVVIAGLAILSLMTLLTLLTGNLTLSMGVIIGGLAFTLLLMLLLVMALKQLAKRVPSHKVSLNWRLALQHWLRQPRLTALQVLAISSTLAIMILVANIRQDLLANWQQSLPNDAPNLFALNIAAEDLSQIRRQWQQADLEVADFFPVVPARLTAINKKPVTELAFASDNALQRDLILAHYPELPDTNQIIEGQWLGLHQYEVSVEQDIAERLQLELGDELTFTANGQAVSVKVSSIRRVDWSTMAPNFYMMLSAESFQQWPSTYLTSIYVPEPQADLILQWIRQYPAVTFLDTRHLITQVQSVIERVTTAIELILMTVLFAAVLVTLSILIAAAPLRLQESAVLMTLGARRQQIRRSQWIEFFIFGSAAALLALTLSTVLQSFLYWQIFNLPVQSHGWLWLWLPPVSGLLLALTSRLVMRKSTQQPPQQILRQLA